MERSERLTTGEANDGELVGKVLGGRYRVTAQLGRGGMGVVCRAVDEMLGREVAVKVLRAYTDASAPELADLRTRMQREARAAARIRHSGVITVHDVAEHEGRPVIVMELIDGPSLDGVLNEHGALDPREVAAIGAKLTDALDAAHRAGVLHRDVKPANVLLDTGGTARAGGYGEGRVVLTDFGIASVETPGDEAATKLTRSGELVGSLDFLPPERAQGEEPGPASDIWSLGMTLYAAVEGNSPFRRTSVWSTLNAIVTDPLPEPRRAGPLAPVLQALMAKDPAARPSAAQAREMLQAVAAGNTLNLTTPPVVSAPPQPGPAPVPFQQPAQQGAEQPMRQPVPQAAPAAHPAAGYTPPGAPRPVPPPPAGERRTEPIPARRRGGIAVAAAAAAVVLAGGGVAYALMGTGGSGSGKGTQAASKVGAPAADPSMGDAKTGLTSPGASSSASDSASASADSPGRPSSGPTASGGGATNPATPGSGGSGGNGGGGGGSGSGGGGAGAPGPAGPTATAPSVSTSCGGWSHQDPNPGTYGYTTGGWNLKSGPYENCSTVATTSSGTKVWYHCYVTNAYGNTWWWVRIAGTDTSGWIVSGHLGRQNGPSTPC